MRCQRTRFEVCVDGHLKTSLVRKARHHLVPHHRVRDRIREASRNPYVELTHWIKQICQLGDSDFHRVCRHYQIDFAALDRDVTSALALLPAGATSISDFSHHLEAAVERAWILASLEFGSRCIRSAWLLAALLQTPELRRLLTAMSPAFQKIPADQLNESITGIIAGSPEDHEGSHDACALPRATPGEASGAFAPTGEGRSTLAKYCTDLTALASAGEIDPVIGRDHEIRSMIDILLRRRQNNPLLAGEAGVGKTAVVEGLALAIASGAVPPALREVRLMSLDVGALLAGASMRGEFESRLKSLLEEASRSAQPIVLFVDEVHTLVGAGGQAGTGDAANLLKPALARGNLRTVGATTWSEYKRHIEKDPALTRRFQVLQVEEPEVSAAIEMVRGLVPTFKRHHDVTILDEAVRAAVLLSHRYVPARQLPDKAISLLDTACARVAMSLHSPPAAIAQGRHRLSALQTERALLIDESAIAQGGGAHTQRLADVTAALATESLALSAQEASWHEELLLVRRIQALRHDLRNTGSASEVLNPPDELRQLEAELALRQQDAPLIYPQVDERVVAAIIADWTGIPVGRMVTDDVDAVFQLQATLEARVIGQARALGTITERIQTAKARLTDPDKPVGVFLLVGPSGVGKTETALALADAMYGGEQNLITLNMSEFQESHSVSTLKGAPPGYIGYGEGGVLTEAVRRRPYSVILLDEVEKAHPDVHEVFYQVFDKGSMEDGEGRRIDFRNTTILLTCNTASELIAAMCDDSSIPGIGVLREALEPALHDVFPPAFIGRLVVVPYLPLSESTLNDIVALHLNRVAVRLHEQHGIALRYTPALGHHIIERCGVHETGARRLIAFIEQNLLPALSRQWLGAFQAKRRILRIRADIAAGAPGERELPAGESIVCHSEYA